MPRFSAQGYSQEEVRQRRAWVQDQAGVELPLVASCAIPTEQMRGNIENPIGAVQMPLGIAGPLLVHGEHARGMFYVPMATTEGALVRSYERGMVMLTRAGGVTVRVFADENLVSPIFTFESVAEAHRFVAELPRHFDSLRAEAESTTRHGRLLRVEPRPSGRAVIVNFYYHTADAQGMNMIVKATEHAAAWLVARGVAPRFRVFSGLSSEKRASGFLLGGGKGKRVVAGARIPAGVLQAYMRVAPQEMAAVWHDTVIGHLQAGAIGYNGHYANGLAAIFIACGQDVANVANAAVGITDYEVTAEGDLHASVTLPSLTVATVGGGTALGTSRECLGILGCAGAGHARKFAEIVAAALLGGELSMAGAIASGEFVAAHETYGRNRPPGDGRP
ncbi:MAG TPA: hydroxymethylglutaryl-CoA reductase [Vicinamibacterales bacterium]|nr:hydroxymethylglutaryl-CoA reductase [Vicinamibacterales bacterium]